METAMNKKMWVRPGVCTAPTTIGADVGGFGAFAPSDKPTRRGAFIGTYTADRWRRASGENPYMGNNDYVLQVGEWRASPTTNRPDVARNMMMAIQEPPPGKVANCHFIFYSKAGDIGAQCAKSKSVACVAVHAARDLDAGEELFIHYGDSKGRR